MSEESKGEGGVGGGGVEGGGVEEGGLEEGGLEEIESPALSALLKRSLAPEEPAAAPTAQDDAKLLANVQRKLRQRSKGKFYSDGWSTSQSRVNYALVAMIMLVTIIAVYLALGPTAISR
jgi:hypothetical protein